MKRIENTLRLSASDLANHLGCRHLTNLDRAAAEGRAIPPTWRDPALEILKQRGLAHESAYLDHLRAQGRTIFALAPTATNGDPPGPAFERTVEAMRQGADVIVQATLTSTRWLGRADVLLRVDSPSSLGAYSYEVVDTKLARETRAGTILQLCLYSEMVADVQGVVPQNMYVVTPRSDFKPETFRVHDYQAYFRLVKRRLETLIDALAPAAGAPEPTYPDPVPQCEICRWWSGCDRRRHSDDHLCLVAGITKLQTREIQTWGVETLDSLAQLPLPLEHVPRRGNRLSYVRVREQARVQKAGRTAGRPVHELLPREAGRGLALLPAPSPGDLFFDVEGDPFVDDNGIEYLLGFATAEDCEAPDYHGFWAFTRADERQAFEGFMDGVLERWQRWPDLHIYHYTPYDPSALKRLMCRYATREIDLDRMLRAGLFVDLHAVVKQSLRASVEKYSIKDLEPFFQFARETKLPDASAARRAIDRALELNAAEDITEEQRRTVESYNRDDCLSAWRLRNWLEELRAQVTAGGETIERPAPPAMEEESKTSERDARFQALAARLTQDVPTDRADRSPEQQATWVLAQVLQWHRREEKVKWWEYFRLSGLDDEELLGEKDALVGLEFVEDVGKSDRSRVHRYRFPKQDVSIRVGDELCFAGEEQKKAKAGEVVAIDLVARTVDLKKPKAMLEVHEATLFEHKVINTGTLADALFRMGEWVAEHGIDAPGPYRAGRDLLLPRPPRLIASSKGLRAGDESSLDGARRLAAELDASVLPIQGPPGTGKTYTGARMIVALVRAGRKVGVTAISHKVIRNLLDEVVEAAAEEHVPISVVQKVSEPLGGNSSVRELADREANAALSDPTVHVVGATSWLWAGAEQHECVDVLFVDEAGQMSLANVLAASQGAKNLVLLGDPQQLEQPQQATHPEGTHVSALEHLLGEEKTLHRIAACSWKRRGACIRRWSNSRRRCSTSRGCARAPGSSAKLWTARRVSRARACGSSRSSTRGNQSAAPEEVEAVVALVEELTRGGVCWINAKSVTAPITRSEILIVAPFNAQVSDLEARLPGGRVGTVDRFQGQEAPVVIYSMTSSTPDDAPRGMEFLYSLTRLNVATSRARCATILVANPRLFEPDCRTPRQMQLANAFCRYLEMVQRR